MAQRQIDKLRGGVKFSQLLGMKHKLSVELAQGGYITQKYLPFGPINRLIPYLTRRAHESYGIRDQIKDQVKQIQAEIRIRMKVF
jgi:proline dehydrogenase